jgi:hypothetical protein
VFLFIKLEEPTKKHPFTKENSWKKDEFFCLTKLEKTMKSFLKWLEGYKWTFDCCGGQAFKTLICKFKAQASF